MSTIRFDALDEHGRSTGEPPIIIQGDVEVQYALTGESDHRLMPPQHAWSYTQTFDFTEVHPQAIYTVFEVWPRGVRVPKWLRKHAKRRKLADPALKRYSIGQVARGADLRKHNLRK
jgi:hypothetical protein